MMGLFTFRWRGNWRTVAAAAALTVLTVAAGALSQLLDGVWHPLGEAVLVAFGIFVAVMFGLAFRARTREIDEYGRELRERGPGGER